MALRSPVAILEAADSVGSEFQPNGGPYFILMKGHAGGEWKLQIKAPDGKWMDIADDSGGVLFDSDGLQYFYTQGYLPYRLTGGAAGAKAWLFTGDPLPGVTG